MPAADHDHPRLPHFPDHDGPRVWFITCANGAVGLPLCKQLLAHGDYVAAGVKSLGIEAEEERNQEFKEFLEKLIDAAANDQTDYDIGEDGNGSNAGEQDPEEKATWKDRLRVVALDARSIGQCHSAVAETIETFGRLDILLCCDSEVVVGTVEELSQSSRTLSVVRDQFETNFFGPVNIIKACLPVFRSTSNGHIILLSATTAHLGTPGLGIYCASQWATEGYCDSLAYEVAPFNIRLSIVQPTMEINVLTNRIVAAPQMQCYSEENNPAPLVRKIFSSLLDRLEASSEPTTGDQLYSDEVTSVFAPVSKTMKENLVAETVHAIAAIGGHENPPARHIVGQDGTAAVKEKLKTVSEELEDFVECSAIVDIGKP